MCDSGESPGVSVCHTFRSMNCPSICQFHDSFVCQSIHSSTWKYIHPSVHLLSVPSIQPSAKFTVKVTRHVAGPNFWKVQILGKLPSVHTSSHLSVNPSGSLSSTPSPSAENLSKFPGNYRERNTLNYLHNIPLN